jgi:hypothetical protein
VAAQGHSEGLVPIEFDQEFFEAWFVRQVEAYLAKVVAFEAYCERRNDG